MHCANLIQQLIDMCGYLSQSKNLAVRSIRKSVMRVSRHGHVSGRKNSKLGILISGPRSPGMPVLQGGSCVRPQHLSLSWLSLAQYFSGRKGQKGGNPKLPDRLKKILVI